MLEQYIEKIYEINQEISKRASQGDISNVIQLVNKKRELIDKIKGAIYIKISQKMTNESIRTLATAINNLKGETIFDLNSGDVAIKQAILDWSFSKEELYDMETTYPKYDVKGTYGEIAISAGKPEYSRPVNLKVAGLHEFENISDDFRYRKIEQLSDDKITSGAAELLNSCLIPNSYGYSLAQARGLLKKLKEEMKHRNYDGISQFYESFTEFSERLSSLKSSENGDFISEDSYDIFRIYEILMKLDVDYFITGTQKCSRSQHYHWAKFQSKDVLNDYFSTRPDKFATTRTLSKDDLSKRILDSFIETLKTNGILKGYVDGEDIEEYLISQKNKYEELFSDYNNIIVDLAQSRVLPRDYKEGEDYEAFLKDYAEKYNIDFSYSHDTVSKDFINDIKAKGLIDEQIQVGDLGTYIEAQIRLYDDLIDVNRALKSSDLYDNYQLFQEMIRCDFEHGKYYSSAHLNIMREGTINPNYISHRAYLPFMETLFHKLNPRLSQAFVAKLNENGVSNLISKKNIYNEIVTKYINILNDIQRKTARIGEDNHTIGLISGDSQLESKANYLLKFLVEDYASLKSVISKIEHSIDFEEKFVREHSEYEIAQNVRLNQESKQLNSDFGIQIEENYDALADVLSTSNASKTR